MPRIHFGVGTGELLASMGAAGADVVGVDYRVSLTDGIARLGRPGYAVQGNLDPALLFAPWEVLEAKVRAILEEGRAAPGHIFNLGHGVLPRHRPRRADPRRRAGPRRVRPRVLTPPARPGTAAAPPSGAAPHES